MKNSGFKVWEFAFVGGGGGVGVGAVGIRFLEGAMKEIGQTSLKETNQLSMQGFDTLHMSGSMVQVRFWTWAWL